MHVAMFQEIWLDASTEPLHVPGYEIIGRRDRSDMPNRGGVLVLCRQDVKNVVLLNSSPDAARLWLLAQRDSGSIVLCDWYPPPGEDNFLEILGSELEYASSQTDEVVICGDLSVHSRRWA